MRPRFFFCKLIVENCKCLENNIEQLKLTIEHLQLSYDNILNSYSYKIGRFFTFPISFILKLIKKNNKCNE